MQFKLNHAAFASLAAMATALVAQPALAQSAPAASSDNPFGDIVVIARKVGESSQSLPITVAAFSGKDLENRVVLNAQDLQTITPGLTISNNPTGGVPIFAIRGTATELGIDGGVALYFNDVPLMSTVGIMGNFFDLQTIEILKGPQGTQFGTNTTGGTISLRTNLPTDKFEGYVKAGYGNFNRREFEGMLNIPVSDVVGFRFAGNYVKRDGYMKNLDAGPTTRDRYGDENHYALRGTMSIHSGPVKNDLIVDYYNRDEAPAAGAPIAFFPTTSGIDLVKLGARLGTYDTVHIGQDPSGVTLPNYGRAKLFGIEDRLNIDVSDNLSIRNVLGFRHDHTTTTEDSGRITPVSVWVLKDTHSSQWTDDLTLRYNGMGGRLRASLGGYLSMLDWDNGFNTNVLQGLAPVLYAAFIGTPVPPALNGFVINTNNFEKRHNTSKAVYFNTEFDITDTLGISGGVRHNWDSVYSEVTAGGFPFFDFATPHPFGVLPDTSFDFFPSTPGNPQRNPCSPSNLAGYPNKDLTLCRASRGTDFEGTSWTAVVTNKFSAKVLGYAKISHGYLSGGTNFSLREVPFFKPENNTMIEAGIKADWLVGSRPIRTNIAIYHAKISDKQVFANGNYNPSGSGFGVVNAAKETVYGLDFESRFSPFDGMTIDVNYNYVHAKFDEFLYPGIGGDATGKPSGKPGDNFIPGVDLSGATPSQTPKHQLNVAATYVWPTPASVGKVSTTVSAYYTSEITQSNRLGKYDSDNGGAALNKLPGYTLFNASLNWENVAGSPVSVQLWMRNIGNKHYLTATNIQFATFGWTSGTFGAPRTFGAAATVRF